MKVNRKLKKAAALFISAAMLQGMLLPAVSNAQENVVSLSAGSSEVLSADADMADSQVNSITENLPAEDAVAEYRAQESFPAGENGAVPGEELLLEESGGDPVSILVPDEGESVLDDETGDGKPTEDFPGDLTEDQGGSVDILIEEIEPETDPHLEGEPETEEMLLAPALGPTAVSESGDSSEVSSNRSAQNYRYDQWSSPMYSYLVKNDSGYMRVESFSDGVLVEQYDDSLLLQSQRLIDRELSIFGGFYDGSDAYYLVFGQENPGESDSEEVVRIVKYDKRWNRQGQASLRGANTTVPFGAGSLRMAEYGGYLYIRTSHEMYTSSDGLNHQANLMIQVRTSDMTITDHYADVMNSSVGYVSHSFNQFILVDDEGNLVALDHGDAYPRAILLGMYGQKAGSGTFQSWYENVNLLTFQGETGKNYTGATVGGLEYSSSSYLTAGSSVPQDENWEDYNVQNIFVTTTSRSRFSESGSSLRWITDYPQGGDVSASTPQLVKLSSDLFLLLWDEMTTDSWYPEPQKLCYLLLDGNGSPVGDICKVDGYLSDCKPVVSDGEAVWYVTDGEKLTFYMVDSDGNFRSEVGHIHDYEPDMAFEMTEVEVGLIEETVSNKLTTNTDGTVTYSSSDPDIAVVDQEGNVTLKGLGSCTITANAAAGIDYRAKSLSYTLNVLDLLRQTIEVSETFTCTYGDESFPLDASCEGDAKLEYSVADDSVAEVSEEGIVTVRNAGTTQIYVKAEPTDRYTGAQAEVSLTVNPKSINDVKVVFSKIGVLLWPECQEYIEVLDNGSILEKDKDYSYWIRYWIGDSEVEVSDLTLEVNGYGNYTGSVTKTIGVIREKTVLSDLAIEEEGAVLSWEQELGALGYEIYRKQGSEEYQCAQVIEDNSITSWTDEQAKNTDERISYYVRAYTKNDSETFYAEASDTESVNIPLEECTVELSESSCTYSGTEKTPSVTVEYDGESLREEWDYTVSYENNINAGTASVILTGEGLYRGTEKKEFTITPAEMSSCKIQLSEDSYEYYYEEEREPEVTVSYGDMTLERGRDYTVSYENNEEVGTASVIITGKGNYEGSEERTFTITPDSISSCILELSQDSYVYDGTEKEPLVEVNYDDRYLTEGLDYTVSYENNKNAGTASVTAIGKGNYEGRLEGEFTITPAPISSCLTELSQSSYEYDGTAKEPLVTVDHGSVTLKEGQDYTVSYGNNENAGTASVMITGKGNYEGSEEREFTITPAPMSSCLVELSQSSYEYDGKKKEPSVTASYNGRDLKEDQDYTVSYSDNVNEGTASVLVSGKGNYSGSVKKQFTIRKVSPSAKPDLSMGTAELSQNSYVYDGTAKKPSVTVSYDGKKLKEDRDYTVSYKNNVEVGIASVVVTGKGDYKGSIERLFTILEPSTPDDPSTPTGPSTPDDPSTPTGPSTPTDPSTPTEPSDPDEPSTPTEPQEPETNPGDNPDMSRFHLAGCNIWLGGAKCTYNGKAKKPSVVVDHDGVKLTENQDYTVSYQDNVNAGTASVVITGIGAYRGSVQKTFKIKKAEQSLKVSISSRTIKRGKKAQIKVESRIGKVTYTSKNVRIAKVTKKGVVKGISAGKVVIKVKAAGNENYKAASKKIKVTVKK